MVKNATLKAYITELEYKIADIERLAQESSMDMAKVKYSHENQTLDLNPLLKSLDIKIALITGLSCNAIKTRKG